MKQNLLYFYRSVGIRRHANPDAYIVSPPALRQVVESTLVLLLGEPDRRTRQYETMYGRHQLVTTWRWVRHQMEYSRLTGGWGILGDAPNVTYQMYRPAHDAVASIVDAWLERNPKMNVYSVAAALGYPYIRGDGKEGHGVWFTRFTRGTDTYSEAIFAGYNHSTRKIEVYKDVGGFMSPMEEPV